MSRVQGGVDQAILQADIPADICMIVGVSGGADSVVLLDTLDRINREHGRGWTLRVVHVNHQLRGPESDRDAAFVRELCERRDLSVHIVALDTKSYARQYRLSIETAAREQRYSALEDQRSRMGAALIAVAHTRDDQAETVLLHLLRGTGIYGLAGMAQRSGYIVRPLLYVPRETVRAVVVERRLQYREDNSNADTRHTRNRLRRDVIPAMEFIHPGAASAVARAGALLARDGSLLTHEIQELMALLGVSGGLGSVQASTPAWNALHPSLQGHTLAALFAMVLGHRRDVYEDHIAMVASALRAGESHSIRHRLPQNLTLDVGPACFRISTGPVDKKPEMGVLDLSLPGDLKVPGGLISAQRHDEVDRTTLDRWLAVAGPLHLFADATRLGQVLRVRSRRPGDRIRPLGMKGTRKVQDILVDRRVQRSERDSVIVIENEHHIIWLVGMTVDSRAAIDPRSTTIVHLKFTPDQAELP